MKLNWKWKPTWSKSSDDDGHHDGGPDDGGDGDNEVQCDDQEQDSEVKTAARQAGKMLQPSLLPSTPKPPFDCPYSFHRLSPSDNPSQDQPGGQVTDPMGTAVLAGRSRLSSQAYSLTRKQIYLF